MRIRAAISVPAVFAAAAALLLAAPQSQAAAGHAKPARCTEQALTLRAKAAAGDPSVVRVSVTNRGARACVVDRVPTVTFADLDGAALPVPQGGSGTYLLGAGRTAYAAMRTIADPADPEARRTNAITVAASASQWGRPFSAAQLGAGREVRVWEPVTTWWQPTAAAADRALGVS
ncbi:Tat pathway signal sequence domain protein [Streptomyces cellostaticus]|uniref:Tat pathway signal sequence domain protein n=1 Tax=Streptomyces cellostaticus TaxID=67285 RepID=A0A117PW99_9ACTN|nr:DUF4232 domain-containing protein [Streptomyces cellostaticus]KUM95508.1 Tat pathway signal sequence domain protein [Streptomyces cellostaticus]GHI09926.1 hypothetical protein Scel_82470 [Streptomyces cellostaticus]